MHKYEVMVILDSDIEERTVGTSLDKFLNVIRNGGGTVDSVDIWGRRRFAYEINHKWEGIYVVLEISTEGRDLHEVERVLHLADEVVRHKVMRLPENEAARRGPHRKTFTKADVRGFCSCGTFSCPVRPKRCPG